MIITITRAVRMIAAAGGLAALAACGGGGMDDAPPPVQPSAPPGDAVPASASQSIGGYIGYLTQLVKVQLDTAQPVDVSQVTPPTSETAGPLPTQ